MAKKQAPAVDMTGMEVVEELHPADESVEYTDVTGKDDLPEGVADPAKDVEEQKPAKKPAKKAEPKVAEEEVPEDLKGKTPAQLARMYKEAQTLIGRQGTELGELRRVADKYITTHLDKPAAKAEAKLEPKRDEVEFFTKPYDAVEAAVANHPAIKKLEGEVKAAATREMVRQRKETAAEFQRRHPDAGEIMGDQEFRDWVEKSPIRQALLLRAHQHYDLAAGDDVFSTWKELKAARTPPVTEEKKPTGKPVAGKEAARVPTGGNAAPRGTAGTGEGKIYRRADVIKLMTDDPERYRLMGDEITKAYQEGRVR